MYLEQIKKLVLLQDIDNKLIECREKLENLPKELDSLRSNKETMENKIKELEEKLDFLKQQKEKLKFEIEENDSKIKKVKNKLMMISNSKEYQAMMRELDNFERLNRTKEEELTNLMEDINLHQKDFEALLAEKEELESRIGELEAKLDTELKDVEQKISDLEQQREDYCQSIPAPILSRYNFIRERLSQPVVVAVSQGICKGCHISIPPQVFVDLQKGDHILNCPNCQRLIYWEEFYSEESKES
ncbi:MAG: C4-type zinc ribbon domain-containing protein [Desulfonauticus sp.]|nr:C4-type zinc ribbon domain-containing protein [Desulfonauticus sp.]